MLLTIFVLAGIVAIAHRPTYASLHVVARSRRCRSFYAWAQEVQRIHCLRVRDLTPRDVEIPREPYIIVTNHADSHYTMGAFLAMALCTHRPCRVVAYKNYAKLSAWGGWVNRILEGDIRIDVNLSKHEKESQMVREIQGTLDSGRDVVMYVDAAGKKNKDQKKPMRALNYAVLSHFPVVPKQVLHILRPRWGSNTFHVRRYCATTDLDKVVELRRRLVENEK